MATQRVERVEVGGGSFAGFPALLHLRFAGPGAAAISWPHTLRFLARTLEG